MVNTQKIVEVLLYTREVIEENKLYLTELDAAIGDGDHGINMAKGFNAAKEKIESSEFDNPGALLKSVGMALISKVGGASGPLYGTMFLNAGKIIGDKEEIDVKDLVEMLDSGLEGVKMRGKANLGDKTMIDSIEPSIEAMRASIEAGDDYKVTLEKAVEAATKGVAYTETIAAKKGRAAYLGDRSIGHKDPGAESFRFIIKSISDSFQ